MASRTVTNTLLLLVVLCLALIVLKMYNVHPVTEAEGGAGELPRTVIAGCYDLAMNGGCSQYPYIRVTKDGYLITAK
jgi:hypothetical protein